MKLGDYMPIKFDKGFIYISRLMVGELGDEDHLYMLLWKSYFVLMTRAQYDRLLSDYDDKIKKADSRKKQKYIDDKSRISTSVHKLKVHGDGIEFGRRVYIPVDVRSRYNISDVAGVRYTRTGYEFWNPSLFEVYFPEVVAAYNEDNLSIYFNADNSSCCCSIEGHLNAKCGDYVVIISGDGFLEIRLTEQWRELLQSYKNKISSKSVSLDVKRVLSDLYREISSDFSVAVVNSRGRIYIPMKYARNHGFCEVSCTRVVVERHEGFIRLITSPSYDLSSDRADGSDRKPR